MEIIKEGLDGSIWYGGPQGLTRFVGGQYINYSTFNSLISNSINAITVDAYGKIWVGRPDGLSVFDGVNWTYPDFGNTAANNIKAIEFADNGDVWIGTYYYLIIYNGFAYYHYSITHGLPSNHINCITKANDGTMWVGTTSGLARFDNPGFTTFNTSDG